MSYRQRLADELRRSASDTEQPNIWQMDWPLRIGYLSVTVATFVVPFTLVTLPASAIALNMVQYSLIVALVTLLLLMLGDRLTRAVADLLGGERWS